MCSYEEVIFITDPESLLSWNIIDNLSTIVLTFKYMFKCAVIQHIFQYWLNRSWTWLSPSLILLIISSLWFIQCFHVLTFSLLLYLKYLIWKGLAYSYFGHSGIQEKHFQLWYKLFRNNREKIHKNYLVSDHGKLVLQTF